MKKLLATIFLFSVVILKAEVDLSSPYHSIYNHLYNLQKDSYNPSKAAESLPNTAPSKEREENAIKLKQILDGKGLYIKMADVPNNPNYSDSLSNKQTYILSLSEPQIFLEKNGKKWQYSKETIDAIPTIYKEVFPFGTQIFVSLLPVKIGSIKILGLFLWQWMGLFIIVAVALLIHYLLSMLVDKILQFIINKKSIVNEAKKKLINEMASAFSLLVVFYAVYALIPGLQINPKIQQYFVKGLAIFLIFLSASLFIKIFAFAMNYFERIVMRTHSKLDDQLLPVVKKLFKLLVYIIALSLALKQLNVNLTAIIAGLSIGGLALALASQETVKNFIGSVTIFIDHPFEIGDYIELPGTEGTVEEVGMRATRLLSPNQSIVYIPNGELSNMIIDNLGLRIYRRWLWNIGVEYNTKPDVLEEFCSKAYETINEMPYVVKERTVVRLNELGASSINILTMIFFNVKTYNEELNCKHEILVKLIRLAEDMNVNFAFPTQTLYLKNETS